MLDFTAAQGVQWLGLPIAALSQLQSGLIVGSNLRKDHPLFAQRIRQAAKAGCKVFSINERVLRLGSACQRFGGCGW